MRAMRTRSHILGELRTRTGFPFAQVERLERALTHSSARKDDGADYERLEFLGDRVLGLVVADLLFRLYPAADEGELSLRFNQLVSAEMCAEIADELRLHELIRAGSDIRSIKGKRMKNVRADVMESLIAAVYLEGGLDAARSFVLRFWEARASADGGARQDAKTALQEWSHQATGATPAYRTLSREGPDHEPLFTVEVSVPGREPAAAVGRSKRLAEQSAAETLLLREGVWMECATQ